MMMLALKNVLINIFLHVHSCFMSCQPCFSCPFLCNKCCSTCRFGNLNSSQTSFLKKSKLFLIQHLLYLFSYRKSQNEERKHEIFIFYCFWISVRPTFCAFLLSALWFWWYIREKFDTITGTGSAMTKTPDSEQTPPIILPSIVFGTISPYLK